MQRTGQLLNSLGPQAKQERAADGVPMLRFVRDRLEPRSEMLVEVQI